MTEVVEFSVKNSLGQTIVHVNDRNMEAVAWGEITLAANTVGQITWPQCDCPIVFLRPPVNVLIFRGKTIPGVDGTFGNTCNIMCHVGATIKWVVGGFRRDTGFVGNTGLFIRDEQGRVGFDSGRRYLRLTNPPPFWYAFQDGRPNWVNVTPGTWSNGVVSFPAHPPWTANTYFAFQSLRVRSDTQYYNYYYGAGLHGGYTNVIAVQRHRAVRDMVDNSGIGFYDEWSEDWSPHIDMTCEFFP